MEHKFSKIRSSLIAHRSSLIAVNESRPCRGKIYFPAAFLRPFLLLLFPALLLGCDPPDSADTGGGQKTFPDSADTGGGQKTFPEWIQGKWGIDTATAASDSTTQALANLFGSAELEFTDTKAISRLQDPQSGLTETTTTDLNSPPSGTSFTLSDGQVLVKAAEGQTKFTKQADNSVNVEFSVDGTAFFRVGKLARR